MKNIFIVSILCSLVLICNPAVAQTRTADGTVAIRKQAPADRIMITVLPVAAPEQLAEESVTVTETLRRSLAASDLFDIVPYQLIVETLWEYYPAFLSANPHDVNINANDVDIIGRLGSVEKERIALLIGCEYVIDGIIHPAGGKSSLLAVDVYKKSARAVLVSFSAEIKPDGSFYEVTKTVAQKIEGYFFELFADDYVLAILNQITGHTISHDRATELLERLIEKYPDSLFLWAGLMIVNHYIGQNDMIITAGERWFRERDAREKQQIRFFSACNENPYFILGKTYMKKYNYKRAQQVLYAGYKTFPFNTEKLKNELIVCLRLLGKHQQADLIDAQKE